MGIEMNKANSLEFTLAIGCALNCNYCPQEKLINRYKEHKCKVMEFDTFTKALTRIKPGGGVIISGMVEPFHNPNCAKMIKYAYENGYKVRLFTSLTGVTDEDIDIIKNVELDEFTIHIPDEQYNSKFNITEEYLRIFDRVQALFKDRISAYSVHGKIHKEMTGRILKNKPIANVMFDRAGNLEKQGLLHKNAKGKIRCMAGSKTNIGIWTPEVLPDGTVTLCCMNYGMKHVLGNIVKQSWEDIYAGAEYQKILKGFEDETIDILCRNCTGAVGLEELPSSVLKQAVSDYKVNGRLETELERIAGKIADSDNICVFGLGRMFTDQYFYLLWNTAINANVFSDNNEAIWNTRINDITCIEPSQLSEYNNLLVVTFVKNDFAIRNRLKNLGITNIISIMEIYDAINR